MLKRKPYQGVWNIIRFNWHFYLLSCCICILLVIASTFLPFYRSCFLIALCIVLLPTLISLLVSYYVYDLSGFYKLAWLDLVGLKNSDGIVNINAGFDETSELLIEKINPKLFRALDFYDPKIHTEVSIKRARSAGYIYEDTIQISTDKILLPENSFSTAFLIFSAHEIRNEEERINFLELIKEKVSGQIVIVEHLRDVPNFIAYTIGFFHFYSRKTWHQNFEKAGLTLTLEKKINPFVSLFILE